MNLSTSLEMVKALADSSRLMILHALLERAQYVEELSERLNLAASTVSFHLKKLEKANLVYKTKEQYYVMFYANRDALALTLQELIDVEDIETAVQEERIQRYKQKVIRAFFRQGKLIRLPAQNKKRWIVLEEIAKRFEPGRRYTEPEVNERIAEVYEDYCTIRRECVEERLMTRDGSTYWVPDAPEPAPRTGLRQSFQESLLSKSLLTKDQENRT